MLADHLLVVILPLRTQHHSGRPHMKLLNLRVEDSSLAVNTDLVEQAQQVRRNEVEFAPILALD